MTAEKRRATTVSKIEITEIIPELARSVRLVSKAGPGCVRAHSVRMSNVCIRIRIHARVRSREGNKRRSASRFPSRFRNRSRRDAAVSARSIYLSASHTNNLDPARFSFLNTRAIYPLSATSRDLRAADTPTREH